MTDHKLAELINDAIDIEEGLTDWEVEFIESIRSQYDSGCKLTDKQIARLKQIVEEKGL